MEQVGLILYFLFWGTGLLIGIILVIYFLLKRLDDRKKETFEKRDN